VAARKEALKKPQLARVSYRDDPILRSWVTGS